MKISWNWLSSFLDTDFFSPYTLAENITKNGCEVESIDYPIFLGAKDIILDISITPNRTDLLSLVGLLKEIEIIIKASSFFNLSGKVNNIIRREIKSNVETFTDVDSRGYVYRSYFYNISMKESPLWIRRTLLSSDISPQNTIIDIINYIMLKWGQPLDAIKIVNDSRVSETEQFNFIKKTYSKLNNFTGENNIKYTTNHNLLVTTYKNEIAYVNGVIHNADFVVDSFTQSFYLEGFIPYESKVERDAKLLGIRDDRSIRYGKKENKTLLKYAYIEACILIQEYAYTCSQSIIYNNEPESENTSVTQKPVILSLDKVRNKLGPIKREDRKLHIQSKSVKNILNMLSIKYVSKIVAVEAIVPIHRKADLSRDIDLIEEVGRILGFDHFLDAIPLFSSSKGFLCRDKVIRHLKYQLRSVGLTELVTYSLIANNTPQSIRLSNPLAREYADLRKSLVQGIFKKVLYNYDKNTSHLQGFEVGRVFQYTNAQYIEKEFLSGVLGGSIVKYNWSSKDKDVHWHQAKGQFELIISSLIVDYEWTKFSCISHPFDNSIFHPNKSGLIKLKKNIIAIFGEISPVARREANFESPLFAFEIDLQALVRVYHDSQNTTKRVFKAYSVYPIITRDVACNVERKVNVVYLINKIYSLIGYDKLLKDIRLFDEYIDEQGRRSIAFRLSYQSSKETLKTKEIDILTEKIKLFLEQDFLGNLE